MRRYLPLLPPSHDASPSRQVHPAPLELLARVETGAVLLVAAFLDYRDGRSSRHLLDVSELNELVPLALDIHGWLGVVHNLVQTSGVEFESVSRLGVGWWGSCAMIVCDGKSLGEQEGTPQILSRFL